MRAKYYYSFDCRITIGFESDSAQAIEGILRENLLRQRPSVDDQFGSLQDLRDIDPPAYIQNPIRTYLQNEIERFLRYNIDISEFKLVGFRTNSGSLNILLEIGFVTAGAFATVVGTIDFLSKHLSFNLEKLSNRFVKIEMMPRYTKIKIGPKGNRTKYKFLNQAIKVIGLLLLFILCVFGSTYYVIETRTLNEDQQRRQIIQAIKEYETQKSQVIDSTIIVDGSK